MKGDFDHALADYNDVLSLSPSFARAYNNRGIVYAHRCELEKALTGYNQALKLDPKYMEAYFNRGCTWFEKGELDKAIADYDQVLSGSRDSGAVRHNRSNAWKDKGRYDKGIADYTQVLRINPDDVPTRNSLAWLQATCPDKKYPYGKNAVENARRAVQLDAGKRWQCLGTLAAAYAECGDFN